MLFKNIILLLSLWSAANVFGKTGKYLITMPGMKPELAQSFTKKGNAFEFTLNKNAKVKKGKKEFAVDMNMIKTSLEKRLKKFKVKVTGTGNKGMISFNGDEADFLKSLGKARIKPARQKSNIAAASSVSDGGVRARTSVRNPDANEVRGVLLKPGSPAMVLINSVGKNWTGKIGKKPTAFDLGQTNLKPNQPVYITPLQVNNKGVWQAKLIKTK